jgi:hypothetical protein
MAGEDMSEPREKEMAVTTLPLIPIVPVHEVENGWWCLFDSRFGPERVVGALGWFGEDAEVVCLRVCDGREPGPTERTIYRGSFEEVIVVWRPEKT